MHVAANGGGTLSTLAALSSSRKAAKKPDIWCTCYSSCSLLPGLLLGAYVFQAPRAFKRMRCGYSPSRVLRQAEAE
jgi:hypothetical protein